MTYLVKRSVGVAVSLDTFSLTKSLLECLSQSKSSVLCRVMVIDMQITFALEVQRHSSVLG
jgi:hypothetical protein